jgi:hypothetical protein
MAIEASVEVAVTYTVLIVIQGSSWLRVGVGAPDGFFVGGKVHQSGEDAKRNRDVTDDVIAARSVVQETAPPNAHEAADLVAEKTKPLNMDKC